MRNIIQSLLVAVALVTTTTTAPEAAQSTSQEQALLQFERAVDQYAFLHRQVERSVGGTPSSGAMASAIRAERIVPGEGTLFTPLVAVAFRERIHRALASGRCTVAGIGLSSVVPRPNDPAAGTARLPECVAATLPKLPPELEYHLTGVVLVLVDVHAGVVVDVVHGACPARND
jgi:hypothetical protein